MNEVKKYFPEGGILSKDIVASGERRVPFRPLGPLSDIVVEEMPMALNRARGGDLTHAYETLRRVEALAERVETGLPKPGTREYQVARLDVLMLYVGFSHSGLSIGPRLSELVGRVSQDSIPALTYEDIVLHNPIEERDANGTVIRRDPRTFTHGEVGADEEHFYGIHQDLEHAIQPAVVALRRAIAAVTKDHTAYDIDESLTSKRTADDALRALDVLIANTRTVGRGMKHFDEFRSYLNPIPKEYLAPTLSNTEYAGPSGAYSGTIHAMDLLISGFVFGRVLPDDEVVQYFRANRMYMPHADYDLLDDALAFATQDKTFLHYRDSNNENLVDTVKRYAEKLLMFRRVHAGSVTRQVPSVMRNDNEIGTGGISNVAVFLAGRVRRTEEAIGRLHVIRMQQDSNRLNMF